MDNGSQGSVRALLHVATHIQVDVTLAWMASPSRWVLGPSVIVLPVSWIQSFWIKSPRYWLSSQLVTLDSVPMFLAHEGTEQVVARG